jgi:hypothetical protein
MRAGREAGAEPPARAPRPSVRRSDNALWGHHDEGRALDDARDASAHFLPSSAKSEGHQRLRRGRFARAKAKSPATERPAPGRSGVTPARRWPLQPPTKPARRNSIRSNIIAAPTLKAQQRLVRPSHADEPAQARRVAPRSEGRKKSGGGERRLVSWLYSPRRLGAAAADQGPRGLERARLHCRQRLWRSPGAL